MSETVMAYFDKNKETELVTNASPFGLSAILTQKVPGSKLPISAALCLMLKDDTVKPSGKPLLLFGLLNVYMFTYMEDISH
jgi:hypothetical protein